jgi:hypothetical protein
MRDELVLRSAKWSIYTQLAFTAVTAASLFVPLGEKERPLLHVAVLETISQVIEFVYYLIAAYYYRGIRTWTRYIDWYVSTQVMLVSFMAFFVYRNSGRTLDVLFADPGLAPATAAVMTLNAVMLTFGLTVEVVDGFPYRVAFLSLGMLAFLALFLVVFHAHVLRSGDGLQVALFMTVFVVWGCYGLAATMPYAPKNVAYNGLDILSKNFYGLFIFVYAVSTTGSGGS